MSNISLNIPELKDKYFDYRQDCWGDSFTWSFERNLNQIIKLAIHHSVTNPQGKTGQQQVDEVGVIHKNRSWAGFGYHFVIDTEGKVWYVGDIDTGRANITANNEKIIGVCLIGDFTKHLPIAYQINSTHNLCKFFLFNYPALSNISTWEDVIGHKEAVNLWPGATATACPGTNWKGVDDSLYNRIKDDKWQGYPLPEPLTDGCEAFKGQVRTILYGKGYTWWKIRKLKELLPK